MLLQIYNYQCGNCKNKFKATELPGEPYGEFLLRSKNGDTVYLNAIGGDPVFEEISQLIDKHNITSNLDDLARSKIMHNIYGKICDVASDNSEYSMFMHPLCPHCKSTNMSSWTPIDPPELVKMDVSPITYKSWNSKTNPEKKVLIDLALNSYISRKN